MRRLDDATAKVLARHLTQRRELRRLERAEIAFGASDGLIDRMMSEIGDGHDDVFAMLLQRKSENYAARARMPNVLMFVRALVAASGRRARGISELRL